MWEFIGEIIGALATILAVILAFILSNKQRRQKSWSYIRQNQLIIIMSFSLFLLILILIAYIASLQSKISSQENKIISQQDAINPKTINYFIDSLIEEKEKCKSGREKTANLSVKIDSLNIIINQKNNEIATLKQQLQQQGLNDSIKISSLKAKLSQIEKEVEQVNKDKSNLEAELKKAKEELHRSKAAIEKLENELKQERIKFQNALELMNKLEPIIGAAMRKPEENKSLQKRITWSPDKKYLAMMYFYQDSGSISIIDLSFKTERTSIRIDNVYQQIKFSADANKLIADSDTIEINIKPPTPKAEIKVAAPKAEIKMAAPETEFKAPNSEKVILPFRSQPISLNNDEVISMLKKYDFFDAIRNKNGHGFINQFEHKIINDDTVVVDHAADLMWQQGGSNNYISYESAKSYIEEINKNSYAGFNDWRLPTLEEAMSLMEPEKKNSLYIDPMFNSAQWWIWTADQVQGESRAWVVGFYGGGCGRYGLGYYYCVRAVRF